MASTKPANTGIARAFAFVALTALLAFQQAGQLQAVATPLNPLPDPHSYVVTGNYAVASDDVPAQTQKGSVTRTLHIKTCNPQANPPIVTNCVPSNADIVAAYLYFEMIDADPVAMTAFKIGATATTIVLAEKLWRSQKRTAAVMTMIGLNSAYVIIVAHNYRTANRLAGR